MINIELPNEPSFSLSNRCYDHCKKKIEKYFMVYQYMPKIFAPPPTYLMYGP